MKSPFWRWQRDEELKEEIKSHLRMATQDRSDRGEMEERAELDARREMGNLGLITEVTRSMWRWTFIELLIQDIRYAIRILAKNRGFTVVAILSLALGIGANTSIFQLLDAVTLRMLPVKHPEQLTEIRIVNRHGITGNYTGRRSSLTYPLWDEIRKHAATPSGQKVFSGVFAWGNDVFDLSQGGEARFVQALWISGDIFNVLGVQPQIGRSFTPEDDQRGCGSPTTIVSYSYWQRTYGGDPSIIGKTITLQGHPFEIIGVAPASFYGLEVGRNFDVAVPICSEAIIYSENSKIGKKQEFWLAAMARLKPDVTPELATAELTLASPALFQETLPNFTPEGTKNYLNFKLGASAASTGTSSLRSTYFTPLLLLLAITGLVLLIACGNIANLMLARATARQREFAIRLALGASRARLVRQLISESLLLAATGATIGVFIAKNLSEFLINFLGVSLDRSIDWRVLAFTTGLAVLTSILFGLLPAFRATQNAPSTVLKSGGLNMTAGGRRFDLRRLLVVFQIALSLVLMIGALLFVGTLRNLSTVDLGIRPDPIMLTSFDLTRANAMGERALAIRRDLLERLRTIPGVNAAAIVENAPIQGSTWKQNIVVDQQPTQISYVNQISSDYFNATGTTLIAGRDFNNDDTPVSPRVAIVNEAFASRFFNGANPVGRTFHFEVSPNQPAPLFQIVGLVKNAKYADLREDFVPIIYKDDSQVKQPDPAPDVLIRSDSSLANLTAAVKQATAEINPAITMSFKPLKGQIDSSLKPEQLMAMLSGYFGGLATLLAIIGIYGVMSYTVSQRQNEIGICMALGADRLRVIGMIVGEVVMLLLAGLALGAVIALAVARTARSMLFGLSPNDPQTFLIAIGILALVGMLAGLLPAHRASKLDPMKALRSE